MRIFPGIIDLVDMNAEVYYDDMGKDMRAEDIPEDMLEQAEEYRKAGRAWPRATKS